MSPYLKQTIYPLPPRGVLPTPALVFYQHLIEDNLRAMLEVVGGKPDRLRPHVKTVKCPAVVRRELALGIHKHKCSTLREAMLLAECGVLDVLVAYTLLGPAVRAFVELSLRYPATTFRVTVDSVQAAEQLDRAAADAGVTVSVLADVDPGLHRSGVLPEQLVEFCRTIAGYAHLRLDGLHCYDGHIKDADPELRTQRAAEVWRQLADAAEAVRSIAGGPLRLVCGGTPTFPFFASLDRDDVECSPGTCVLHDCGYGRKFTDLPFTPAALVLTRVVSRPGTELYCLDCGYKAIASDPPATDRFLIVGREDARIVLQNEEHTVVEASGAGWQIGDELLLCPTHICPTVALHDVAHVLDRSGQVVDRWPITARTRLLGPVG